MKASLGRRRRLVALATSKEWPALAPDDRLIAPTLDRAGLDAEIAVWTDGRVDWRRFDLILVRSCWDYHDDLLRWLAWIGALEASGIGARLCNSPAVLRWNARKTYLAQLHALGVPTIPTRWLSGAALASQEALLAALDASPWQEQVCKPAVSAGALATFRCERSRPEDTRAAVAAAWPELVRRAPVLLQPFVPELASAGEWSLLFFDGRLSHAVLKRPGPGDFRVQEKHGGSTDSESPPPPIVAAAQMALTAAARAIGTGGPAAFLYARVDLVNASAGPLLVELELTEPALFLGAGPGTISPLPVDLLSAAIATRLNA